MSMNFDTKKMVDASIDKAVKRAVTAIIEANKKIEAEQRNYFKDTEKLLYSLPALKLKAEQDEEDIKNNRIVRKRKSTDIVRFSGITGLQKDMDEDEYTENRQASLERTKMEIKRIERALEIIEHDEYYPIIPLKYFDNCTMEDIAERLDRDESTIRRNKNRLINKLKVLLFGADAL